MYVCMYIYIYIYIHYIDTIVMNRDCIGFSITYFIILYFIILSQNTIPLNFSNIIYTLISTSLTILFSE